MDEEVVKLQDKLKHIEQVAEDILIAKQKMVELDRARNGNREALTALRKMARKASSNQETASGGRSKLIQELPDVEQAPGPSSTENEEQAQASCATCGKFDRSTPVWVAVPGAGMFVRRPFHQAHLHIEAEQQAVEVEIGRLQTFLKERSLVLSEEGALANSIGPSLMKALVTLKG